MTCLQLSKCCAPMSFRLKPSEPFASALRRLSHGQIAQKRTLPKSGPAAATWVHETRKSLKRLRALLRLVRFGLAKKEWRRANDELREIGRQLSALRERDVLPQSIAALRKTALPDTAAALDRLEAHLGKTPDPSGPKTAAGRLTDARKALQSADERLGKLVVTGSPSEFLSEGLATTHRAGQRALAAAQSNPTDDAVHDLRKVVQIHWRQMQLLEPAWPEMLRVRVATAKDAAQALGEHHDLAMIIEATQTAASVGLATADVERIVEACRDAQASIESRALPLVARLFAADPRAFADEVMAYWALASAPPEKSRASKQKSKAEVD